MRKTLTAAALAVLVCGAAQAQHRGGYGGGYAPAYHGGHHGDGWVAPVIGGMIAGAVIGNMLSPPPVVYAQPPVVYSQPACNVVVVGYDYYRNPIYQQVCQ